jgi:hypothetical protein
VADQHLETAGGVMKGSELLELVRERWSGEQGAKEPVLAIASGDIGDLPPSTFQSDVIVWNKPYPRSTKLVSDITDGLKRVRHV